MVDGEQVHSWTGSPANPQGYPCVAFFGLTLKAMKPCALPYPYTLSTLGDHIRKKRLGLGMRQKDIARQLEVNVMTVNSWETNRNQPSLRMIPRITEFLGYVPDLDKRTGETAGEWIVRARRARGIRQEDLARQLGVDPGTLAKLERGESEPSPAYRRRLAELSGASSHF